MTTAVLVACLFGPSSLSSKAPSPEVKIFQSAQMKPAVKASVNLETALLNGSDDHMGLFVEGEDVSAFAQQNVQDEIARILEPREDILKVRKGETLAGVLQDAGVSDTDAYNVVKEVTQYFDPRTVKAGQKLKVRLDPVEDPERGGGRYEFSGLNMKISPTEEISVEKKGDETFKSKLLEKEVVAHVKTAHAVIDSSLYSSAAKAGIPASVVAKMIRIYSYQVDFQRDIREGDSIEVMYEAYETEEGDIVRYGNVLFANLSVSDADSPLYRFETSDGSVDYFSPDGKSVKKTLMRTPVDGARMSSGFGMRHHPILGYNKMHKGVDFAAPRGTPIYAAGDGVVEQAGPYAAYGNYIRIRHNDELKTAYAHMKNFAQNISVGRRVKQGQIIGYVGTTGRSTGPHLHYEVLKEGVQVNPNSVDLPVGIVLASQDMRKFKKVVNSLKDEYAKLSQSVKVAQNGKSSSVR